MGVAGWLAQKVMGESKVIAAAGFLIAIGGFATEVIAFLAMGNSEWSYSLRQRLPWKSPLDMVAIGGIAFFIGIYIAWLF
jgi:hypothetical protein